jgi:hypothetical protein
VSDRARAAAVPGARERIGIAALLAAFAAWSGWLVARSSFLVEGRRVFCLFDDAMISMTYARNLVEGHGLNWARQGTPVEGFTHPLWLALMLPANLLPLDLRLRSLVVQVTALVILALAALAAGRLVRDHLAPAEARYGLPAAVLTAFYYPLAYWSLMGMEVPLQALLALLCVHLALDGTFAGRDRHGALWLACTGAYLLRMDMLIVVLVVQAYLVTSGGLRPGGRRSWLLGAAGFTLAVLGYELFRWEYFHDLLPNTYYLKLTGIPVGVRLARGGATLGRFAIAHAPLLLAAAASAVALRRERRLRLPLAVLVAAMAYAAWVGGDAWEEIGLRADRFLAFAAPLLFVVVNAGLDALLARLARRRPSDTFRRALPALAAVATAFLLIAANGLAAGREASWNWRLVTGGERPPLTERHREVYADLRLFERLVAPQAAVATAWAGIPAYFSDYRMVDLLGYNDRHLARMRPNQPLVASRYWEFVPGHVKWNVRYDVDEVRPDAFFQVWGVRGAGSALAVMHSHGYRRRDRFWLRADSPWVRAAYHDGRPPPASRQP